MPVQININNLTLCHKGSNGISTATVPDVCKTPSPGGPVPIPYPNIAMSSDLAKGTTTITADGGNMCANYGSEFSKSTGDEPGTVGGVASSTFIKEATWITFSFDVKFEGKAACRLTDKMFHNHQNTVNCAGLLQAFLDAGLTLEEACKKLLEYINNLTDTPDGKVPNIDPRASDDQVMDDEIRGVNQRIDQQLNGGEGKKWGPLGDGHPDSPKINNKYGKNSFDTHDHYLEKQQNELQNANDEYSDKCGDPPDSAKKAAREPRPTKDQARAARGPLNSSSFSLPELPTLPAPNPTVVAETGIIAITLAIIAEYWWVPALAL